MSVDRLCLKCGYVGPVYTNPNGTERPHPRRGLAGSSAAPECGYLLGTPADDVRSAALASARDEVVRAAKQVNAMLDMIRDDEMVGPVSGNPYGVSPSAGKLLRLKHDELRIAVAALAKLEGK